MAKDAEIRIRLNADEARRQSKAFSQSLRQDFARVIDVYSVAKDAALAFGAALVSTGRLAAQYEKSIAQIKTIVTDAGTTHAALSKQIQDLAQTYGGSAIEQAKGFYEIMSSGAKDVAEAQLLMVQSNRLAIAGGTEVATASKGLLSVLNSYGFAYERAREVSDAYFVAVRDGTASVGELASEISKVAPLAAQLGIDYREIFAAQAVLTKTGMSAADATTRLRGVLEAVISPTAEGAKLAKKLGVDFSAAALAAKGLGGFLQDLKTKTHGSSEQLKILLGRSEALQGALILAADGGGALEQAWQNMTRASGATASALREMQSTLSYKWDLFAAGLESVQLALGNLAKSGGFVANFLDILTPQLQSLARTISDPKITQDMQRISIGIARIGIAALDTYAALNTVAAPMRDAIYWINTQAAKALVSSEQITTEHAQKRTALLFESLHGRTGFIRARAKKELETYIAESESAGRDIDAAAQALQKTSLEQLLATARGNLQILVDGIQTSKKAIRAELEDYGPPLPPPLIYGPEQESGLEKQARADKLAAAEKAAKELAEKLRRIQEENFRYGEQLWSQQDAADKRYLDMLGQQAEKELAIKARAAQKTERLYAQARAKEARAEQREARDREQRFLGRADAFGSAVAGILGAGVDSLAEGKSAVLQATGQMFGGILQQVGLDLVAAGVSSLFKGLIASAGWIGGLVTGPLAIGAGLAIAGIGAGVKAGATPDASSIAGLAPGASGGSPASQGDRSALLFGDPASSRTSSRSSLSSAGANQPSSQIQNIQVNVSMSGFVHGSEAGVARQLADLLRKQGALRPQG